MPSLNERIDYLDAMRATLMMLGIVLHSAHLYNPDQQWLVYSSQHAELFKHLIATIRIFRMPAFFVVSGFFCAMLLRKFGTSAFLQSRLTRLLLPLVSAALTLNLAQALLLQHFNWLPEPVLPYLIHGGWMQHLWFLLDLLLFVLLLCLGAAIPRVRHMAQTTAKLLQQHVPLTVFILLAPLYTLSLISLNQLGIPMYHSWLGIMDLYELLFNLQFFLFGLILFRQPAWLQQFSHGSLRYCTVSLLVLLAARYALTEPQGSLWQLAAVYSDTLLAWNSIMLCFRLFNRLITRRSPLWRFLSDASYSVYLFHHLIVIALGLLVIKAGLAPLPGFCLVVISTFALTLALHHYLIAPNVLLRRVFNGK